MDELNEPVPMDAFQSIMIISLQRIYDAQMAMLMTVNADKARQLASLHEQGRTLAPPFAVAASEDDLETP